ncbi:MAG: 3-oxoacid CoA-transferase subunit B [Gammaproteobacteria bacterium]|nr:3-oxoacid CoA-transferase subunit B [Gammaproteobacteria bacterium]
MSAGLSPDAIAARVAEDLPDGAYVNLGIGMPMRVAEHLPAWRECIMHSENGLLGMGPAPAPGAEDPDLINAGKQPVSVLPGGAFFHHADSFAMIRGGHIDVSILGAYEVAANGDLANWALPGAKAPAVGGAMDLVAGAKQVWVMLAAHVGKDGAPRIVERCTLPLTGPACVNRIYTDLAVIDVTPDGLLVTDLLEGTSEEALQAKTGARLRFAPALRRLPQA